MAQAAKLQPQPWGDGPSDLVRRLLARRPAGAADTRTPYEASFAEPAVPEEEPAPSPQDAAILVLKAALRAERAEIAALQAELADLRR